ncbi:MAG: mono/diheme cytochrome c family protein, partial [Myxococcota bacterium]
QHWHVFEVMKDTSPWAYTPTIGYATIIVSVVVILFFAMVGMIVAFASLGSMKPHGERPAVPARTKLIRTFAVIGLLIVGGWGLGQLKGTKDPTKPKDLAATQARDTAMLTKYDVVDPEKGVYQVPIDAGMDMLVKNPSFLEPHVGMEVDLDEMSPIERGDYLFNKSNFACGACHSVDGSVKQAPTMMGRFGKPSKLEGGEVAFDDAYFKESLVDPAAKFAVGFDKSVNAAAAEMPSFKGKVSDQQLADLMAYLKSL